MSSIIAGYNYDIFISYRQKDNRGERWVSQFVEALKIELEATFKEDVSVYFDENPHERLKETHNVDKSLENKLRCLIFIPIISQTYCDPGSYAWQSEFLPFLKMAGEDRFGRDIKLRNGNVACRILPVRIHDLEKEDINLFQKETGCALRAIDFIFKTETGVIRPLNAHEDHPQDNTNKTFYSDQINKTGLAIKEIILGIKNEHGKGKSIPVSTSEVLAGREDMDISPAPKHRKVVNKNTIAIVITSLILVIPGFLFLPKLLAPEKKLEKSIAVLPFKYLSDEPEKQYLADGMMEAILLHLSKIEELRVLDRTSVEQYRQTTKTTTQITRELDVEYVLEGSFQQYEDNVKLIVQLNSASRKGNIWANEYNNKWSEIFSLQTEVAQKIAGELNIVITTDEKQLIGKVPTNNLAAYDLFLKADKYREEYKKTHDLGSYQTAVDLYLAALKTDKKFARAYVGLAWAYYDRHYWPDYFKQNFLDTCLLFVNQALTIDDKLDEAYYLRGEYYIQNGNIREALINFDKTIKINPNFYSAYIAEGFIYSYYLFDVVRGLENYHKALTLVGVDGRPSLLRTIGHIYADVGFFDKSKYYFEEAFKISNSQIDYLWNLVFNEFRLENYEEALNLCKKCLEIDSTKEINQHFYLYAPGHLDEAYTHARKLVQMYKKSGTPMFYFSHRIGYTFYQMGMLKEADFYLKQQIKYSEESIKLKRPYAQNMDSYYDLSATYAFLGDKDKAYQNLDEYSKMDYFTLNRISYVENDPLYASIRNEERFQRIVKNMKAKNRAEHDRVKKWLEEKGML